MAGFGRISRCLWYRDARIALLCTDSAHRGALRAIHDLVRALGSGGSVAGAGTAIEDLAPDGNELP